MNSMVQNRFLRIALFAAILLNGLPSNSQDATEKAATSKAQDNTKVDTDTKEKIQRTLWGAKISPYVRKVIVTLEEKGISYDLKEILPSKLLLATQKEVPAEFSSISPFGKIPAYSEIDAKDEKFAISDSAVIMDYLNQTVANNPLRPTCPKANARVSWLIKYADDILAPITHKVLFEKIVKPSVLNEKTDQATVDAMLTKELPDVLNFLEKTLEDQRTWIANTKEFSLADIAIVSHIVTLKTANEDLDALIGKYPLLLTYVTKVFQRPSFQKALSK